MVFKSVDEGEALGGVAGLEPARRVSASTSGSSDDALVALLVRAPRIPFVTLIEHLERVYGQGGRVGSQTYRRDHSIRFCHDPSLVFHTSDVAKMRLTPSGIEITSTFLGAIGTVSPLSGFFTEEVLRAASHDSTALLSFYDLFHHRLLSLCYRALQRSRPAASMERAGTDQSTTFALAAAGIAQPRVGALLSSLALLGRARCFARRPQSMAALESVLSLHFPSLAIRVVDFLPRRVPLGGAQRMQLGVANCQLGVSAHVGRSVLGRYEMLRLEIGSADATTLDALLPGGKDYALLRQAVAHVTGGMLHAVADVAIRKGAEPRAVLGGRQGALQLGRSTLLLRSESATELRVRIPLGLEREEARPEFVAL